MACCIIPNYYLEFPCNECCIIANCTVIQKYKILLKKQELYEKTLLINCCFLLCLILNKFKFPKKTYKDNKILFEYVNTSVYF